MGPLLNKFGGRSAGIVGAVIIALGYVTSSLAHNIYVLYLTFGFIAGYTFFHLFYVPPFVKFTDIKFAIGDAQQLCALQTLAIHVGLHKINRSVICDMNSSLVLGKRVE